MKIIMSLKIWTLRAIFWLHHAILINFLRLESKLDVQYINTISKRRNRWFANKYALTLNWRTRKNCFVNFWVWCRAIELILKNRLRICEFVCNCRNNHFWIACNSFLRSSRKLFLDRKSLELSTSILIE